MRGEENTLIGARALPSLIVMPNPIFKWVQADSQQINDFRTVMTGELHHLLLNHSLIMHIAAAGKLADRLHSWLLSAVHTPAIAALKFAPACAGNTSREQVGEFLLVAHWRRGRQYARPCTHQRHHLASPNIADRALPASLQAMAG